MLFLDRVDAGQKLALKLEKYKNKKDSIVIGLPRGGVVTAYEVAMALNLPIDVIITRKIGAPHQPELALGALTQDGKPIIDYNLANMVGATEQQISGVVEIERLELKRRLDIYRNDKPELDLMGKTVILVDDGIATGSTMRAAIISARAIGAKRVVVAVPVAPADTIKNLANQVDELICLYVPDTFFGVGGFYQNFEQVSDNQVIDILK